ncbi:hypothetical protein EU642_22275 [Salmonella enterica]|nr:hypothetical protein [Salmonella enterica]EAR6391579.1 hypothetical protein [Salmonella enterica]EAV1285343.1 hypothetical protein [Salmonella enterica]
MILLYDYVLTSDAAFLWDGVMSKKVEKYTDVNPHQLAELYTRLEILRPVMVPDKWERKQFRALDVCQVCDGDTLLVHSRSYGYGPILPPDDELEDWPKFVLRNRKKAMK